MNKLLTAFGLAAVEKQSNVLRRISLEHIITELLQSLKKRLNNKGLATPAP